MTRDAYPPDRSPLRRPFRIPASWQFTPDQPCNVEACNHPATPDGYCQHHRQDTPMTENPVQADQTNNTTRPTDPGLRKAWEAEQRRAQPDTTPSDATSPHPLGQTVWYRSRTGQWTAPAVVTATPDSLYIPNVEAGHVPPLTGDDHVHLTVLTPGTPGHVSADTATTNPDLVDPDRPNKPAGGSFQEWDIPFWQPDDPRSPLQFESQPAGTWMWPL